MNNRRPPTRETAARWIAAARCWMKPETRDVSRLLTTARRLDQLAARIEARHDKTRRYSGAAEDVRRCRRDITAAAYLAAKEITTRRRRSA